MKIGFVGLGKLGLPCALAIESRGHEVAGYDTSDQVQREIAARTLRYHEAGAQDLIDKTRLRVVDRMADLVAWADLIFVAVQTPHDPRFEGTTPLPPDRADFDYTFLRCAITQIAADAARQNRRPIVSVISTVLPGTMRREIMPIVAGRLRVCYNPFFIAMGTCIDDFLRPEFVLLGIDDAEAAQVVDRFYATITDAPVFRTSVVNAEAIKVFYNTAISTKIAAANAIMEFCHAVPGADVDVVMQALALATRRVVSAAYTTGGMGDGGACHPRDSIALSHYAHALGLSYDWFGQIMVAREAQTRWLDRCGLGQGVQGGHEHRRWQPGVAPRRDLAGGVRDPPDRVGSDRRSRLDADGVVRRAADLLHRDEARGIQGVALRGCIDRDRPVAFRDDT